MNRRARPSQWTRGATLWKLEAVTRGGQGDRFVAAVGGVEHDVFVGLRWAFNDLADTSILGGPVVGYRSGEIIAFFEAERRFGDRWVAEVEARWLLHTDELAPVHDLRRDDFLTLRVSRFFQSRLHSVGRSTV